MHHLIGAGNPSAERLGDRLMAEAHAEDRKPAGRGAHQWQGDAGAIGVAWPWREHDRVGRQGDRVLNSQGVVAIDRSLCAKLAQIVDDVPGEAVVIVDDEQHGAPGSADYRNRPPGRSGSRNPHLPAGSNLDVHPPGPIREMMDADAMPTEAASAICELRPGDGQ